MEDWKSTGGAADYDPASLGLGFVTVFPEDSYVDYTGAQLGSKLYFLKVDDKLVLTALNYRDIARDDTSGLSPFSFLNNCFYRVIRRRHIYCSCGKF